MALLMVWMSSDDSICLIRICNNETGEEGEFYDITTKGGGGLSTTSCLTKIKKNNNNNQSNSEI